MLPPWITDYFLRSNFLIKISPKDLPMVCFVVTQHSESELSLCLRYSKTSSLQATQKKSTDHTENTEISLKAIVQIEKEAVFTYGLFYNKININHCTIDFNNNYNYLRCKYTNKNDMFQIFWALFLLKDLCKLIILIVTGNRK